MAKTVYDTEVVSLLDDTEVVLRPLAISGLRKFMRVWGELTKMDTTNTDDDEVNDKVFDVYVRCSGIALAKELKTKFDEPVLDKSGGLSEEYYDYLEDNLDTKTAERILSVCGNLRLDDPKLQEAIQQATVEAAGAGKK